MHMITKIRSQLYRRRYDFARRDGTRTQEWVLCKTEPEARLTQVQQREFEALCSRFGRPVPGDDSVVGSLPSQGTDA